MPKQVPAVVMQWQTYGSRWDWFYLFAVIGMLVFSLFSLGVVEPWSEAIVVGFATLLASSLLLRVWLDASFQLPMRRCYWPLVAIVALIFAQLVPVSTGLLQTLSPQSVSLRQELLGELAPASGETTTLSLYTYETSHDLRMALVFIVLFVTATSVFRTAEQIKRVLLGVFLIGCAEAGIALLQILTLSTKIHWMMADRGSVITSGSFVNHSHFSQFVNLALGAGVALLLIRVREDSRRDRGGASRWADLRGERYLRPITGIVLCAVAVFTSMSRNGVLSLLVASGIVGLLLYRRGVLSMRGWLIGLVPWGVVVVLFLTNFDAVYERFAVLEDGQSMDARLGMTAGTLRAWRDFPLLGAGLGTHEYLFPQYDQATMTSIAEHADNDWAQLLEEFGLLGAGAVLAFVVSIFGIAGKLMLSGRSSLSTAAFGLCLGLLAVAWHSLSDFGQHLPGIFALTALTSGLIVSIAQHEARKTGRNSRLESSSIQQRITRSVVLGGLLVLCGWATWGSLAAYRGQAWTNVASAIGQRIESEQWEATDQNYADLLGAAELAAAAEPTNVKSGHVLNLMRWRSLSRDRDPQTGQVVLDPAALPFVERIADELAELRKICPIYGPLHGLEGELRLFVLGDPEGSQLIEQGARLAPYAAGANLLAGQLAVREGRLDEAVSYLNRAVALSPGQFAFVAQLYLDTLQRPDLAQQLAGRDYGRMKQLVELLDQSASKNSKYAELAETLRASALDRLRERIAAGEASASETAALAAKEMRDENFDSAVALYRRALSRQYGQVSWRLQLAHALYAQGEPEQALREAKACLRQRPELPAAVRLIEKISVKPTISEDPS